MAEVGVHGGIMWQVEVHGGVTRQVAVVRHVPCAQALTTHVLPGWCSCSSVCGLMPGGVSGGWRVLRGVCLLGTLGRWEDGSGWMFKLFNCLYVSILACDPSRDVSGGVELCTCPQNILSTVLQFEPVPPLN